MNSITPDKFIVGISGNIGSGKSRVCRYLSDYFSIPLVDLDYICRHLLETDKSGFLAIKKQFGSRFIGQDLKIDRAALRKAIFSDHSIREQIDKLIHPLALQALSEELETNNSPLILVEVPLLFEAGWHKFFNKTVIVYADEYTCFRRLICRDNVSAGQAHNAIFSQMPAEKKMLLANHVINNNASWTRTIIEIIRLGQVLRCNFFSWQAREKS